MRHDSLRIVICVLLLFAATAALAIQPGEWVHTTEADFDPGKRENTVITNLGDLKLARLTESLGEMPEDASIVYDLEQLGDALYLAAGPEGRLLVQRGEAIEEIARLESEQIFALGVYDGKPLVAISGAPSRLAVVENNELKTIAELEKVRYIWDVVVDDKTIYLATGIEGQVLAIQPDRFDAAAEENPGLAVVLDTAQPNVLCLGRDGQGRLYAATDTQGLIYRLTPAEGGPWQAMVVYDAPEPEIGALLVTADGTVYAGTADADQARPGRLETAKEEDAGRPETPEPQIVAPPGEPGEGEEPEIPGPPEAEPIEEASEPEMGAELEEEDEMESPPAIEVPGVPAPQPQSLGDDQSQDVAQEAPPQEAPASEPTREQRDQLREVIRQRLLEARRSGALQVGPQHPGAVERAPMPGGARPVAGPPRGASAQRKPGNAVYRIDPQGFVTELFRESVMVLRIVEHEGMLLVATGNEGQLFRIDPEAQETAVLVDLECEQIPALLAPGGGGPRPETGPVMAMATANPASVLRIAPEAARQGTFTSAPLDAGQISLWGKLNVTAGIPAGAEVRLETRSGNVEDPEQGPWSPWSAVKVLSHDENAPALYPRELAIESVPGRFLQYRLTLVDGGQDSPVVDRVAIAYVVPNLKPVIASLQTAYAEAPGGGPRPGGRPGPPVPGGAADTSVPEAKTVLNVVWEASDPNNDRLHYKLEYQPSGSDKWLLLKDDLEQPPFEWNTRQAPDGWYTLRMTASDRLDNTPDMAAQTSRRSSPVLIDNTPPTLQYTLQRPERAGDAAIHVTASDNLSPVRSARYAVDSTDEWQPMLPEDLIFDSTQEKMDITIRGLAPGSHLVVLSVSDAQGNTQYQHVFVEVK